MSDTTEIVVPNVDSKARIILDWDDGQWYISSISNGSDVSVISKNDGTNNVSNNSQMNVKLPLWTDSYKYKKDDMIAYKGNIYISQQNNNIGNDPLNNNFWWKPLVDLSNVDAKTLEGKNISEIASYTLGGHNIGEYYTKNEVENYVLVKINNVDAKKLNGNTFDDIKKDYELKIKNAKETSISESINYFKSEDIDSYQQQLITLFDQEILPDDINQ
jgi:hypothetical protein